MARGKGGLGRGLDSLFEDAAPVFESEHAAVETLPLREIEPDPDQPRKTFEQETLSELAASIAEHGLLQPIAVRPRPMGGYSIVAGERRWRASRMAGLTEVPVVIKDVSDEQAMELALVENLQREDLDPVEEAAGIRELMTRCDLTQEQAARKLGKSRSALANSLRLLNLPETVLELLKSGFINTGHAKVVLGLPTPELQAEAAQIIADNQLNVRQAEALCKKLVKQPARKLTPPTPQSTLPVEVEESLKQALGNEVLRLYDVGVAGLHRLLSNLDEIMSASVVIAIAGMEGALASVVGGLVDCPVIAVPTSVGYGASFGGVSALLSMLNSCASGVSVVNIDNGFGAGYLASRINHMEAKR